MTFDRQRAGLTVLRICIGVFFVFEAVGKLSWISDTSILAHQLSDWSKGAANGSIAQWYLQRVAIPGVAYFARLVPLGEFTAGLAMIGGVWTSLAAFVAFFMAVNFEIASGLLFRYAFLTTGYGLPVVGATLALALAGGRAKSRNLKVKREK